MFLGTNHRSSLYVFLVAFREAEGKDLPLVGDREPLEALQAGQPDGVTSAVGSSLRRAVPQYVKVAAVWRGSCVCAGRQAGFWVLACAGVHGQAVSDICSSLAQPVGSGGVVAKALYTCMCTWCALRYVFGWGLQLWVDPLLPNAMLCLLGGAEYATGSAVFVQKIEKLKASYGSIRRSRGDGECPHCPNEW